jgi:hypothetical protein
MGGRMTKDDIIRMAREAGIDEPESDWMYWAAMERFAALVAAAEREACAQLCERARRVTPPAAQRQEPYDQTALELCEECGWRAMIPGDGCLVCARQKAKPVAQWVELTDDEARALVNRATFGDRTNWQALVYMVDAKLKEKNT